MTSLHWQTSLQNRQCHALCTLGKTSKCWLGLRPIWVVSRLFVLGAYMGARSNAGRHCQYLRQQFETIWFVGCLRHCHADQIRIARLGVHPLLGAMWPLWVKPLTRSTPRHQFLVQMPKAKVSWLLCIGRLVSKTDNVMHFARLVKQASIDLVSDLFGLWAVCLFLGLTNASILMCSYLF